MWKKRRTSSSMHTGVETGLATDLGTPSDELPLKPAQYNTPVANLGKFDKKLATLRAEVSVTDEKIRG